MQRETIMNTNSSQPTTHADWGACPTGTLNSFAKADRQARVQATVKKTAIGLVPTAALLLLVWFGVNSPAKPPGGMGCRSVAISVQSYFNGELEEETEDRSAGAGLWRSLPRRRSRRREDSSAGERVP